jgi:hydrogenase maturation protein HypF
VKIEARRGCATGVVQGVGFRPHVAGLARALGLGGWVANRGAVVEIFVEGPGVRLDEFATRLVSERPAAAHIHSLRWREAEPEGAERFAIEASVVRAEGGGGELGVGPDLRVCPRCLAECRDPDDRRHAWALNGCTACGPRFTIAAAAPWDRARSSMASFEVCPICAGEYEDPEDRRWHAEAIACPRCGPRLRLEDLDGRRPCEPEAAIATAVAMLRRGQVVALKGVGGFALLVDARQQAAVERLRARKHRPAKPLALMVADLAAAEAIAELDPREREALDSAAGPIVLVRRRPSPGVAIAEAVAPGQPRLGLMLATTPAHALLLAGLGGPLVATSGNVHGRPIAIELDDARDQLRGVADAVLVHDRAILRRCDDSVVQVVEGRARVLRLGRGLAPARLALPEPFAGLPPMLGLGASLQAAPMLALAGRAIAWPHVGDLDEPRTRAAMAGAIEDLSALQGHRVSRLAVDAHPDDPSASWATRQPGAFVDRIHHHHAHVAAVLAEHGRAAALGVAWDGVGYGIDGGIWGGEFLEVDARGARRVASLRPFPLPGGDAAARDGLRVLAGLLAAAGLDVPMLPDTEFAELARFVELARRPRLSPPSSSVGRLFDAFAALLGLCRRSRYQAEAARALEHAAAEHGPAPAYPFALVDGLLDWRPMLAEVLAPEARARPALVAARVHATLIAMIVAVAAARRAPRVALAGGCFANRILFTGASAALRERGVEVLAAAAVPPGDGGLALGQLWVAGHRLLTRARSGVPCV